MKKQILFLVLVALLSCHSTKRTTDVTHKQHTELKQQTETTTQGAAASTSTTVADSTGVKNLATLEQLTEQYELRLKLYDTALPLDSLTGKPPLRAEMEISRKQQTVARTTQQQQTQLTTATSAQRDTSYRTHTRQRTDSTTSIRTRDKTSEKSATRWPWGAIVSLAVIAGLILLALRLKK